MNRMASLPQDAQGQTGRGQTGEGKTEVCLGHCGSTGQGFSKARLPLS